MTNNTIKSILTGRLIGKLLAKKESKSESEQVKNWLNEDSRNQQLFDEINNEAHLASKIEELDSYSNSNAWNQLSLNIERRNQKRILRRWKIAAAILLLVGVGGVLSNFIDTSVEPLLQEASLTTIQTERGQSSTVILPDSSVVYLNSGTKLSYNNNFLAESRLVHLEGEAYFEVKRDESKPFVVASELIQVKVLGTSFNVNTFPKHKKVDVILDEGSIELAHNTNRFNTVKLVPGELASFDEDHNILRISDVSSYKYTSWKDGLLIFEDDSMDVVFEKLESWYDIDIEIRDPKINEFVFNATIMDESIEDIFDLIKYACGIKYHVVYSTNPKIVSKVIVSLN